MGGMSKKQLLPLAALAAVGVATGGLGLLPAAGTAATGVAGGTLGAELGGLTAAEMAGIGATGVGEASGGLLATGQGAGVLDKMKGYAGKGMQGLQAANGLGLLQPEQQPQASPNPPGLGGPPPMSSVQLMSGPDQQIEDAMEMERRKRAFAGLSVYLGA